MAPFCLCPIAGGRPLVALVQLSSFDALSSFDRINLGSTFLQSAVLVSFAAVHHGVAAHFRRPGMRDLATVWRLLALGAVLNIFSSWSGAVWQNRELSRALTSMVVALAAASIPYVSSATVALATPGNTADRPRARALRWGLIALVLHAAGVFTLGYTMPDTRVAAVSWSRVLHFIVNLTPAVIVWRCYLSSPQQRMALRLLAFGFSALAARRFLSVMLGFLVDAPNLPFGVDVAVITMDVLAIMSFGVLSLLATTAEEVVNVQAQSVALANAESRLAAGERMESLGRLAAGVAHDFNNVLQVIRLSVDSLGEAPMRPDDREVLKEVDTATAHGRELVGQLLTFARQQPQHPQRFDALERLRTLSALLQRIAGTGVDCSVTVADGSAAIVMDPGQFEQVAINLVANARDAIADGGRITVRLDVVSLGPDARSHVDLVPGQYVRLLVEDTGHGIPPEIREHIFEPFFTTKEIGGGSGLGLATVHGIARRAAGDVALESTPGQGTRFEVYLPAA